MAFFTGQLHPLISEYADGQASETSISPTPVHYCAAIAWSACSTKVCTTTQPGGLNFTISLRGVPVFVLFVLLTKRYRQELFWKDVYFTFIFGLLHHFHIGIPTLLNTCVGIQPSTGPLGRFEMGGDGRVFLEDFLQSKCGNLQACNALFSSFGNEFPVPKMCVDVSTFKVSLEVNVCSVLSASIVWWLRKTASVYSSASCFCHNMST